MPKSKTPRLYRADRRNEFRAKGIIRDWRNFGFSDRANQQAKLLERKTQCSEANALVAKAAAAHVRTGTRHDILATLRKYWNTQKKTRVVSRILRQLAA